MHHLHPLLKHNPERGGGERERKGGRKKMREGQRERMRGRDRVRDKEIEAGVMVGEKVWSHLGRRTLAMVAAREPRM